MRILRSVGSTDTITARAGLNELNDILESSEKQAALRDYEEIYIENVCLQLKVSVTAKFSVFSNNFIFKKFAFLLEPVTNTRLRCLGHLSATFIKHLFILHIANAW